MLRYSRIDDVLHTASDIFVFYFIGGDNGSRVDGRDARKFPNVRPAVQSIALQDICSSRTSVNRSDVIFLVWLATVPTVSSLT